tara:strand:- start:15213 stop:16106 length:894 start_codon:yes stop_codon:yes gene_type:complete
MNITKNSLMLVLVALCFSCSNPTETEKEDPITIPDPEPSRVQVTQLARLSAPDAIKVGTDGNIYASNYGTGIVYKVNRSGRAEVFASNQPGAAGIDFDSLGNMFLARYDANDVVVITPEGELKNTYATGLHGPIALEFDSSGNLFINNHLALFLAKVNNKGQQSNFIDHNIVNTSSLTLDDSGNIYLTSYLHGRIIKINTETGVISNFVSTSINGFGYLTFANNELYATTIKGNKVFRISMQGVVKDLAGTGESGYLDGPGNYSKFTSPIGITTNAAGDTIYVADRETIRLITNFLD